MRRTKTADGSTGTNSCRMNFVRQLILTVACFLACSVGLYAQLGISAPPSGIVGTLYNFQFTAFGGKGPYQWSYNTDIGLPPGLMFSAGNLSGTPTQQGSFQVQIFVFDQGTQMNGQGTFSVF